MALAKHNASTTVKLPRFVLTKTLMNIINSYKWTQVGVNYRIINIKNSLQNYTSFFAFSYCSPFEQSGWLIYDPEKEYIWQGV